MSFFNCWSLIRLMMSTLRLQEHRDWSKILSYHSLNSAMTPLDFAIYPLEIIVPSFASLLWSRVFQLLLELVRSWLLALWLFRRRASLLSFFRLHHSKCFLRDGSDKISLCLKFFSSHSVCWGLRSIAKLCALTPSWPVAIFSGSSWLSGLFKSAASDFFIVEGLTLSRIS